MSHTRELIKQHAGQLKAEEIAAKFGLSEGHVRNIAAEMGISLRVPRAFEPKSDYECAVPPDQQASFAEDVTLIMESKGLRSQSAALVYAVGCAAQVIRDNGEDDR